MRHIRVRDLPGTKVSRRPTGLSLQENVKNRRDSRESHMAAKARPSAGAPSRDFDNWQSIDWPAVARHVRRLQMRIAKATRERRYNKARALQHLLTHSFFAKLWAVRRVVTNRGKNTPGVDGVVWKTPEAKMQAVRSLNRRGYQPQPLRRVYVPKSDGKKQRGLGIPTMKDRAMQALYLLALSPVAETQADPNSYGFRPKRSPADAIKQCFHVLARKDCAQWILDADIEDFFDRLSHAWLLEHIPMDKLVLRKWLKAGMMEDGFLHPTEAGTPQGGIISPVIACMALDGLEATLKQSAPRGAKVHVIRYADDVRITGATREVLIEHVVPMVEAFLEERGLNLSAEKTRIVAIETGFDFLGAHIRKFNGKYRAEPAKKSVQRLLRRCREFIRTHPTAKQESLIRSLNPRIRGWANYFRVVCASKAFDRVDHQIFHSVWRWARRRHSNKSTTWVYDRYYRPRGRRNWIFSVRTRNRKDQVHFLDLVHASSIGTHRYTKIRAQATYFDPEYSEYFRRRELRRKHRQRREARARSEASQLLGFFWAETAGVTGSQRCGLREA